MYVLKLLGLLLVATRSTRSVTIEFGHGWGEPLGTGQANAATGIASSTISNTMSQWQEWAMLHDKAPGLPFPKFEYSTLESDWLRGDSLLAFDISNTNDDDQFDESFSMNVVVQGPGSKIDAPHISFHSQQLGQEAENLDCIIDPNRIRIKWENFPSKEPLENLVPDNRNAHQFGDSFFKNSAVQFKSNLCFGSLINSSQDWTLNTSSNRDASRISIDCQPKSESVEGKTCGCRNENTINSKSQPVDVRENFVPDGFPKRTHKKVKFRNDKYLLGLRVLCPLLNWDLDEVKDYESLCVFLEKETNPEQDEFHDSVAITQHIIKLLFLPKSDRKSVEVGQNNIDVPDPKMIVKAPSTLQKLILISNFVLKLISCRRSGCSLSRKVHDCLMHVCIPVLQCLVICCGKDIDLFQTRWGTRFPHHRFGAVRCPGSVSNHNTCGYQRTKIVKNPDSRDKDSGLMDLNALVVAVSTSKTAVEKLKLCCEFYEKYQSSGRMAQKLVRSYYHHSPKPIWGCFVHHCGQNTNEWIRKWGPRFPHANFGMRKCQGLKSLQCGSIDRPFDIPARHTLRYKPTRDLLPALSEIIEQYDQFVITMTRPMRSPNLNLTTLVRRYLRPVNSCLQRHCAGRVEEFVRRWGESVSYTKFSRDCCPGKGRKDSLICQYDYLSSQD